MSALAAVAELKARNFNPERAVAIAVFTEEEGARFRVACLGSRLITGAIDPAAARALSDDDGVTLAAAMTAAGCDASLLGPDEDLLARVGAFVELHVEQGRALAPLGAAIGVAEGIWPHGRWRFDFAGRADHAGTARLADRNDPMLPYASTVLAARRLAAEHGAVATFGKVIAEPGGANGVNSAVRAWLDARAADEDTLAETAAAIRAAAAAAAAEHGVTFGATRESYTPLVRFDETLRDRLTGVLGAAGITAPVLPTGAGHDAGDPRRPDPDGHAVRPQPDRRLALARRTRRAGRLRSRRARARPGPRGPSGPPVTRRRWLADLAWLPGQGVCRDVLIEADGDRFTSVTPAAAPTASPAPQHKPHPPHQPHPTLNASAASPFPASPTRTRTPSTAPCAAPPRRTAARSGPGASGCTRSPRGSTRTATSPWPAPCTPRWRWPGSPAWASSTTCTTSRTARPTPTRTRWDTP